MNHKYLNITSALIWVLFIIIMYFIIKYNWSRRWLYYYGSKIDGPFGWPVIGSAHYFIGGQKVFFKTLTKLLEPYPSVAKFWFGNNLIVSVSQPEDVEIILNNCLKKPIIYNFALSFLGNGLLTSPVDIWKSRRKMINPTFNSKNLNSFMEIFGKHATHLANRLDENCGKESFDVLSKLFSCTFDIACETLADDNNTILHDKETFLRKLLRIEDLLMIRICSIWFYIDFLWNRSSLCREMNKTCKEVYAIAKQVVKFKKSSLNQNPDDGMDNFYDVVFLFLLVLDNIHKEKRFINHLLKLSKTNTEIDETALEDELQTILITASETTALTVGITLITLGIYPEIQEKIDQELDMIFGNDDREPTLEDVNKMEYLERVIKETLRLLSPVPIIARATDRDIKLDSCTIPTGSFVLIPIYLISSKSEFWEEPNKFDPDRFLLENSSNRHRCAFIPFSLGPRNCVGFKFAMMSVKVLLSTILRKYTIKPSEYKKLEDVKIIVGIVAKPVSGYKIKLEKKIIEK
ncbi:cytochrome P450 4C1-like isoform X2 [Tribolium madens]|uniref:cytochrome P450 4C1-like isoform X2 n=1 Tax=Tribolium madens TaxID=41895 RepID=UPI001CF74E7B|nr:cytochrome P450 4C1-like isoform X2 [Tribolium madens]